LDNFLNKDGAVIVEKLIATIQENKVYLGEIDGAIGDGDHGVNMSKGFTLAKQRLTGRKTNFSEGFKELGTILLTEIGGSMGPLYGTFFLAMAKTAKPVIDKENFSEMLHAAIQGLAKFSTAVVGDKTLMDTLIPAQIAYDQALGEEKDFTEALVALQKAAQIGRDSTVDMVAKLGRASRLGERSRGVLDAGATSCELILRSMAETIKTLLN